MVWHSPSLMFVLDLHTRQRVGHRSASVVRSSVYTRVGQRQIKPTVLDFCSQRHRDNRRCGLWPMRTIIHLTVRAEASEMGPSVEVIRLAAVCLMNCPLRCTSWRRTKLTIEMREAMSRSKQAECGVLGSQAWTVHIHWCHESSTQPTTKPRGRAKATRCMRGVLRRTTLGRMTSVASRPPRRSRQW
jgi:hypothetical protein